MKKKQKNNLVYLVLAGIVGYIIYKKYFNKPTVNTTSLPTSTVSTNSTPTLSSLPTNEILYTPAEQTTTITTTPAANDISIKYVMAGINKIPTQI